MALIFLAAIIGLLFFLHLPDYNVQKNGDVSPPTLASGLNSSNISFSKIAVDLKHNIHLIYELNRYEYRYARSSDLGKTWDEPENQSSKLQNNSFSVFAGITIIGDTVITWGRYHYSEHKPSSHGLLDINHSGLMRTISYDNGATWSTNQQSLIEKQLNGSTLGKTEFAFYRDTLFCILEKREDSQNYGLYFSKSGDLGFSWSELITLIPPKYYNGGSPISFCISEGILYTALQGKTNAEASGSIIILRSTDRGETWGMLLQIYLSGNSNDPSSRQYIEDLTMELLNSKLIVSLLYGYFRYYISDDNGETWQSHELKIRPAYGRLFYINNNNELNLIWIDDRNCYKDWRAYLPAPISYMMIMDGDPTWPNNDLYQQNLDKSSSKPQRLTPPYSYIRPPCFLVNDFSDSLMVMWLGRDKVNSKYEAFSEPSQLLYKFIPNN